MAIGMGILICNCKNARLHFFERKFLQRIRQSCKI